MKIEIGQLYLHVSSDTLYRIHDIDLDLSRQIWVCEIISSRVYSRYAKYITWHEDFILSTVPLNTLTRLEKIIYNIVDNKVE